MYTIVLTFSCLASYFCGLEDSRVIDLGIVYDSLQSCAEDVPSVKFWMPEFVARSKDLLDWEHVQIAINCVFSR